MNKDEKKTVKQAAKLEKQKAKQSAIDAKKAEFVARVIAKRTEKESKVEDNAQRLRDKAALCGQLTATETFGGKTIRFYSKGFVSITSNLLKEKQPEELLDISFSADVTKKSGAGRLVAGVMTAGLNIGLTENIRGDIYLSITTKVTTHMIHVETPSPSKMKSARKIVAIAKALISRQDQSRPVISDVTKLTSTGVATALGDQLSKLAELHQSGALSESEFAAAKSKLIGN